MFLFSFVLCWGLLAQETIPDSPAATRAQRVISADQRLVVYGRDGATRTAVLTEISDLRNELSFVLGSEKAGGSTGPYPLLNDLIVTLYGEPGDTPQESSFGRQIRGVEGSPRFRIELAVDLARGLNRERLREEALECLLLDKGLTPELQAGREIKVAPWISTGLRERMDWRRGEADRGLYRALFKSGYMLDIEEMLEIANTRDLDAAQRTAFRISAGGFVMALLGQDSGQETFRNFIAEAVVNEGEPSLLVRKFFFETGISDQSFAIWWALQMQNLTQNFFSETLTITETDAAIDTILKGNLEQEDGSYRSYRLAAFQEIIDLPEESRKILLDQMLERLGMLSFRAFPSYQPIVNGYARVIRQLQTGNTEGLAESLASIDVERQLFRKVGLRTRDYLDWYRISNATQVTGDFRSYQDLKRKLESKVTVNPGPLDRYLDGVQRLYDQ